MPLVRATVRNEYGLGSAELYKEVSRQEDPKAILDGVAVAGLVGILRQLGDLAEFAAEVFHGLQEQILTTSCRSHKLIARVQSIEASLPTLEKAVFAQTSHVHFAYVAGCNWHPRFRKEHRGFTCDDLPRYIMDSYEECRDPPHLHVLDKFDTGGAGSCLKRYSDPNFFRMASNNLKESDSIKFHKHKKSRKQKKKRSLPINQDSWLASTSNRTGSIQCSTSYADWRSPPDSSSSIDMSLKSDMQQEYFDNNMIPKHGHDLHSEIYVESGNNKYGLGLPTSNEHDEIPCSVHSGKAIGVVENVNSMRNLSPEHVATGGINVFEKKDNIEDACAVEKDDLTDCGDQFEDIGSEVDHYVDALNAIDSESDNDLDHQIKHERVQCGLNSDNILPGDLHVLDNYEIENHVRSNNNFPCLSPKLEESTDPRSVSSPNLEDYCHTFKSSLVSPSLPEVDDSEISLAPDKAKLDFDVALFEAGSNKLPEGRSGRQSENSVYDRTSDGVCSSETSVMEKERGVTFSEAIPITIWSNGILLGLEPSKPSDFSKVSTTTYGSMANEEADRPSLKLNNGVKIVEAERDVKCSTPCCSDLDEKIANVVIDSTVEPRNAKDEDVLDTCSKACQSTDDDQPMLFEFGHRFHGNDFQDTVSLETHNKRELSSFSRINIRHPNLSSDKSGCHTSSAKVHKNDFRWNLDIDSPHSSPPLKHMNIMFNPPNGFPVSKLKLKYPDCQDSDDTVRDTYPLFQLVPEKILSLGDVDSASDDDTFCRSSLYMSDDYVDNQSDVDSVFWEGESPKSSSTEPKDNGKYVNIDMKLRSADSSLSPTILDLPCLNTINNTGKMYGHDTMDESCDFTHQNEKQSHSLSPTSPISQLQDFKAALTELEDQHLGEFEILPSKRVFGQSQLMNNDPANREKPDSLPFSKEVEKVPDMKDGFHQVTTKTVKVNSGHASVDDRVSAMLMKADAIRQRAIGGEEDDDDSVWSD